MVTRHCGRGVADVTIPSPSIIPRPVSGVSARPSCHRTRLFRQERLASVAGVTLPETDREVQPIIFDSCDMPPIRLGKGAGPPHERFCFAENELAPGALRGDNGAYTAGLAVDRNPGWKRPEKYVATVPQVFSLPADAEERYDIFIVPRLSSLQRSLVPIAVSQD